MDEFQIVRSLLLRLAGDAPVEAPLAAALAKWARPHARWLGLPAGGAAPLTAAALLDAVAEPRPPRALPPDHVLALAGTLAELLALDGFDAALLRLLVGCGRLDRVEELADLAGKHGHELPALLGRIAGEIGGGGRLSRDEAMRAVRRSAVIRLDLAGFSTDRKGEITVDLSWSLLRLLDRAPTEGADMLDMLAGRRQGAALALADFTHVADAALMVRLVRGALAERAAGINLFIHGPPGTGKTEFARTLAEAAGAELRAVGEADDEGDEPTRPERVAALALAQRLLGPRGGTVLLFDEMEDLIGDAKPEAGGRMAGRQGSKVFVNRLLETNPVPVIWTSNALGNVDGAILRRMSFVLPMGLPPRGAAMAMLERIAHDERIVPGEGFAALIEAAPETAAVLRVAARAGRLAGDGEGGLRTAEVLVRALRRGELPPPGPGRFDLDLLEAELPCGAAFDGAAFERLSCTIREGALDVSLLLGGPPGTGKTALAHHLARALDRPLLAKRASDLLSPFVGETEALIAAAFAEARRREAVLLLDEADSLLFDRSAARASWEIAQVNELLSWLDSHPLPVVAATNHAGRLDPATLRRFVFKIELRPLGVRRARLAFERSFGLPAPPTLAQVRNLTPGDFAVVRRQLRHAPAAGAGELVKRLRGEAEARPGGGGRIGF